MVFLAFYLLWIKKRNNSVLRIYNNRNGRCRNMIGSMRLELRHPDACLADKCDERSSVDLIARPLERSNQEI